jgi:hypothetical protein
MIALAFAALLVGEFDGGFDCPKGADARACARQAECVLANYRARRPSSGVTENEAALVARIEAEHSCGLIAWSRVVTASTSLALYRSVSPACPQALCAPCEVCDATVPVVASSLGACILCGGGMIAASSALCKGP